MGLFDRVLGGGGDTGDDHGDDDTDSTTYQIVPRDPQTKQRQSIPDSVEDGAWTTEDWHMSKSQFRGEYGSQIDPTLEYLCVPLSAGRYPQYDNPVWVIEPQREPRDDVDEVKRELRQLREESRLGIDPEADIEDQILAGVLNGQIDKATAKEVLELKKEISPDVQSHSHLDDVDLTNQKEVAMAGVADLLSGYNSIQDIMEDLTQGALSGATQAQSVGPAGGSPQLPQGGQPAQQPAQQPARQDQPPAPPEADAEVVDEQTADPETDVDADAETGGSSGAEQAAEGILEGGDPMQASPDTPTAAAPSRTDPDAGDVDAPDPDDGPDEQSADPETDVDADDEHTESADADTTDTEDSK